MKKEHTTPNTTMKISKKMEKAIAKVKKEYGECNISYGVEMYPINCVGRGFYDYAEIDLRPTICRTIIVNHDGEIFY